jgi:hypothetical protein
MASQLPNRSRPHVARGPSRSRAPKASLQARERHRGAAMAARISPLLLLTRHGIAVLAVLAGIVSMSFGTTASLAGGGALIGAGLSIWLISWLYRIGVEGDTDRDSEERARRVFDRTGRWPDA